MYEILAVIVLSFLVFGILLLFSAITGEFINSYLSGSTDDIQARTSEVSYCARIDTGRIPSDTGID